MIKEGDKVVCIQSVPADSWYPAITEGKHYVVNGVVECCGHTAIDIGLSLLRQSEISACPICNKTFYESSPCWDVNYFRKIEPEYKAVMVDSEISEQAKELIGITETIAR